MTELPCLVDSMSFPSSIEEAGGEGGGIQRCRVGKLCSFRGFTCLVFLYFLLFVTYTPEYPARRVSGFNRPHDDSSSHSPTWPQLSA